LVEGFSKKSPDFLSGRNSENKVVVFPKKEYKKGMYVNVFVNECTPATLLGDGID
jgi:tRNA-2-methylthio-N6-dimethylallyladenosine synthase